MSDQVTVTIDGVDVSVPSGTLVVDAAKKVDVDIPVFCYHPKLDPVGMCRMCLVEVGTPVRDRQSGEVVTDESGQPQIRFAPVLQTGCTVQVSDGMVVRTATANVKEARDDIIEFLLTSHPLDCPICDKGGECPLQNLTMRYGPGTSRFYFEDKQKAQKNVPLGDLIFLDRERCIQCARCTRFQGEIAGDPVIAFHNRGRRLEIVTMSEPGFDSYWSGNTTDICPVGALTTADFRFGARPWEMTPVASLCPHCPVGCNTTLSTRREAKAGGRTVIKRVLPRQNERVNEIWICDKGRFVHHFADSPERLTKPLIREDGQLVESTWEEALDIVAGRLQMAKDSVAGLIGDRLSNEDLYLFQKLLRQGLDSPDVDFLSRSMAGGEVVAKIGIAAGSNLAELKAGDALLVVASDLHEEAPVWWLRVKQAAERGATLVVLNLRPTRLDDLATQAIHYEPGQALSTAHQLLNAAKVDAGGQNGGQLQAAADDLVDAKNLLVIYGGEGLSYSETDTLARILANLLLVKQDNGDGGTGHAGRINNGLVPVWPHGNTQGAWDMGAVPHLEPGYAKAEKIGRGAADILAAASSGALKALYVAGADPVGDGLLVDRSELDFLVVQELFATETAKLADVVLPAQSWAEREGSYTNGERRVQRFYPVIPPLGECRADWQILAQVGERVGLGKPSFAASLVFREIASSVGIYEGLDYRKLAWTEEQWPQVGGEDVYYGGTSYKNESGLGLQWAAVAESENVPAFELPEIAAAAPEGLTVVSTAALYRQGTLIELTALLADRMANPTLLLGASDAERHGIADGDRLSLKLAGSPVQATARVNGHVPAGAAFLHGAGPRGFAGPAEIAKLEDTED
ncbi:MAG: NADH-quinone oxidoreductase subunit NuoG [Chloroflexota bacterium]|nr:MAG: NADH-quinone oxidoreductase subunit NuoG [Chloroflexota bacterium]